MKSWRFDDLTSLYTREGHQVPGHSMNRKQTANSKQTKFVAHGRMREYEAILDNEGYYKVFSECIACISM